MFDWDQVYTFMEERHCYFVHEIIFSQDVEYLQISFKITFYLWTNAITHLLKSTDFVMFKKYSITGCIWAL